MYQLPNAAPPNLYKLTPKTAQAKPTKNNSKIARTRKLTNVKNRSNSKICYKAHFCCQNIWQLSRKALTLHSQLRNSAAGGQMTARAKV
jgi:hypothetical protein